MYREHVIGQKALTLWFSQTLSREVATSKHDIIFVLTRMCPLESSLKLSQIIGHSSNLLYFTYVGSFFDKRSEQVLYLRSGNLSRESAS